MTTEQAEEKLRILVNSNANMSRGKYAAAAVHAALTAAGVHPGIPVIVLGGQRDHVANCRTVIHDAGKTEVEPGTPTAGTDWSPALSSPPADDVREALDAEAVRKEYLSRYSHANVRDRYDADLLMAGFADGAAWAAEVRLRGTVTDPVALGALSRTQDRMGWNHAIRSEGAES